MRYSNSAVILIEQSYPFLKSPEEFSGNTRSKLLEYFATPQMRHSLKVELAAVIDAGKPFVQATYKLEGDGPIAIECYESLTSLILVFVNPQSVISTD